MLTLEEVARGLNARKVGANYMAKCIGEGHDDRTASLSLSAGRDGRLLYKCHAGCSQEAITAAIRARFGSGNNGAVSIPARSEPNGKRPPVPAEVARRKLNEQGFHAVGQYYYGPDIRKVRFHHNTRLQAGKNKPEKQFRWEHRVNGEWVTGAGDGPIPLYVNRVFQERDVVEFALGVEGEAKADAAGEMGIPAFSFRDGSETALEVLKGLDVVLFPDRDEAGAKKVGEAVGKISKRARSLRVINPGDPIPPKGDILDLVQMGWGRAEIDALIRDAEPVGSAPEQQKAFSVEQIEWPSTYGARAVEWVVEDLIAVNTVNLVTGESGSGKTTIVEKIAFCVSQGHDFGDLTTSKRPVLILDRENPLPIVNKRHELLEMSPASNFYYWGTWLEQDPPQPTAAPVLEFISRCSTPPLIVIDSLVRFQGGEENSASDSRKFFGELRGLTRLGCTVIIIHHTGKAETAKEYRGSSDLKAAVDSAYLLEDLSGGKIDRLRLKAFKSRLIVRSPLELRRNRGQFSVVGSAAPDEQTKSNTEQLRDLLIANPGLQVAEFCSLAVAKGLGRDRARAFLVEGRNANIRIDRGLNNAKLHYWDEGGAND